jgi:hypothetical protein
MIRRVLSGFPVILLFASTFAFAQNPGTDKKMSVAMLATWVKTANPNELPGWGSDEEEWPYPKPPDGWKGLSEAGISVTLWNALAQKYKSVSLIQVTFQNTSEAPVEIPLNKLSDAQLHTDGQSETLIPAVAMYWRVIAGRWNWMLAAGWDKPITMILPAKAKAELRFVFTSSVSGDAFSLPRLGKVKIKKAN